MKYWVRAAVAALVAAAGFASPAPAQSGKTIRIIVPFAPAGSSDVLARVLQGPLQQELGQTVIVENRAGAGTNIGTAEVARADADGSTLLITSSAFVVNPALYKTIPYDPFKDFAPIAALPVAPNIFAVNAGGNIASLTRRDRHRQGQSAETQLRQPRQRHDAATDHGAVQAQGRSRHHQHRL